MFRLLQWRPASQTVALRNAQHAAAALAELRREREEVERYLSTVLPKPGAAVGA